MAGYEVSVGSDMLPGILNGPDGLAKLVETVLNQILEAQVTEAQSWWLNYRTDFKTQNRSSWAASPSRS